MPKTRGAVVIGVNKTGGLTPLESAVDGADAFARWLRTEGFTVTTITDTAGPVTPQQVAEAIEPFVTSGTYEQLVIYFSGHGYWKNDAELWLLSRAPDDANAAVSWAETAEFAKDCGIPNVVMISDACRSIPNTPRTLKVRGSIVFPNEDAQRTRAKVDKFMAAALGASAYEIPLGANGKKVSVFTHCFLQAFAKPDPEMIEEVDEDGQPIKVVPNRRLGKYLEREVSALLTKVSVLYDQLPDAEILSDDDIYIGRVRNSSAPSVLQPGAGANLESSVDLESTTELERNAPSRENATLPTAPAPIRLRDVAAVAVARALNQQPTIAADRLEQVAVIAKASGFEDAMRSAQCSPKITHFETETGFAVTGSAVDVALPVRRGHAEVLAPGDGQRPGVVRVTLDAAAGSILLGFADGRGTMLAALRGFIGHVSVDRGRVNHVCYIPSNNSWRWGGYAAQRDRIEELRAAAAAAARFGVFRVDDKGRAAALANEIRIDKGLDPTLGLYAAYAYSEADLRDQIDSVLDYMRGDLSVDLFDVAMLARKLSQANLDRGHIVPCCPMLTQGWNLLRARRIQLPKVLDDAQDELEPALWTTFKQGRAGMIIDAIKRGELP